MSTKTEIKNKIASINDGGLNSAVEVRQVLGVGDAVDIEDSLLENFYPTSITDRTNQSPESQVITTKFGNDVIYNVTITKIGRNVNMNGTIFNNTSNPLSYPNIFTITSAEYLQDANIYNCIGGNSSTDTAHLTLGSNIFKLNGTLGISEFFAFDFNYNVLD
jgi:hypothetical protein